jgi:enterochelin esterase-like enzyme
LPGRENRAIAGLSMGAGISAFLTDAAATNEKLRLLFFSCGTEDDRIAALKKTWDDLSAHHINFTARTYPGEHEWRVWRHSLADLAPMLFR